MPERVRMFLPGMPERVRRFVPGMPERVCMFLFGMPECFRFIALRQNKSAVYTALLSR